MHTKQRAVAYACDLLFCEMFLQSKSGEHSCENLTPSRKQKSGNCSSTVRKASAECGIGDDINAANQQHKSALL